MSKFLEFFITVALCAFFGGLTCWIVGFLFNSTTVVNIGNLLSVGFALYGGAHVLTTD